MDGELENDTQRSIYPVCITRGSVKKSLRSSEDNNITCRRPAYCCKGVLGSTDDPYTNTYGTSTYYSAYIHDM